MDNAVRKKAKEYIDRLPEDKVKEIIDFIEYLSEKNKKEMEKEDKEWLNAELTEHPEYDWGTEGPPQGRPVKYIEGVGLIIEGGRPDDEK